MQATLDHEQADAAQRASELDRDLRFIERLEGIRLERVEESTWAYEQLQRIDAAYATAFREFGIDLDQLDPNESKLLLSHRSDPLKLALFIDEWALIRHRVRGKNDAESWRRLIASARLVDQDAWRNAVRAHVGSDNLKALHNLAGDEGALVRQPARSLLLLAQVLRDYDHEKDDDVFRKQEYELLKRAWRLRQTNSGFAPNLRRANREDGVRYWTAAVALRPASAGAHHNLGEELAPSVLNRLTVTWTRDDYLEADSIRLHCPREPG